MALWCCEQETGSLLAPIDKATGLVKCVRVSRYLARRNEISRRRVVKHLRDAFDYGDDWNPTRIPHYARRILVLCEGISKSSGLALF